MFFFAIALLVGASNAHLMLTYPPARKFPLDFLVTKFTGEPCGNMKAAVPQVVWKAGAEINITWRQNLVHDGGYAIKLLKKDGTLVETLKDRLQENTGEENIVKVKLPDGKPCTHCILQVTREYESMKMNMVSCADVKIKNTGKNANCMAGTQSSQSDRCKCPKGGSYRGRYCQYKDECTNDTDCNGHGKCEQVSPEDAPFNNAKWCFCDPGYYGLKCNRKGVLKGKDFDRERFHYKKLSDNPKTELYYRVVAVPSKPTDRLHLMTLKPGSKLFMKPNQIEVVLVSKTKSWVSVGWRPGNVDPMCQNFPHKMMSDKMNKSMMAEKWGKESVHPMHCLDLVMGAARGDRSKLGDFYSRDRSTPLMDSQMGTGNYNSLTSATGWETEGSTVIWFRKTLKPWGKSDHALLPREKAAKKGSQVMVAWAVGQSTPGCASKMDMAKNHTDDEFRYHGNCRGYVYLDLTKPPPGAGSLTRYSTVTLGLVFLLGRFA